MCLGIPYRVVELHDDDTCLVQVGSGLQSCFVGLVDDVRPGEWLLVHAGFAVAKIGEDDARRNLALIERYVFGAELGGAELERQAREGLAEAAGSPEEAPR